LAGIVPSRLTVVFTYIAAGSGSVLTFSHWSSLRQRRFPVRLLGRVTVATRMVLFGVMPVAAVAGGAVARAEGSRALFVAAGCIGLAACVWAWAVGLGSLRVDDVITDQQRLRQRARWLPTISLSERLWSLAPSAPEP